jgi:hypothetical protein
LYIALFVTSVMAPALSVVEGLAQGDPDALYRGRTEERNVREAASIWEARLAASPKDFESAWKLARAMYWLGGHTAEKERRPALERGVAAGRTAATLEPGRPEGHFWMAASMGALAESFGVRQGLRYRGAIKDALQIVLKIDPAFQGGSADRALGRWYFKVPGLFGGSKQQSEAHLRASLKYDPQSTASHFFLAELLIDQGRDRDAASELNAVLAAPINPDWEPEDREFKDKAKTLLATLRR